MLMTPQNEDWNEFCAILEGPEGCDFKKDENDKIVWKCDSSMDRPLANKILAEYFPEIDIEGSLEYFDEHGGLCDCEILFNVGDE
jgi:hypothetical protein